MMIIGCSSGGDGKVATCFSATNFGQVYQFVEEQIHEGHSVFYEYEGYRLYLADSLTIEFRKDNYTIAKANKKEGIISLAVNAQNNIRTTAAIDQLFCTIVE